VTSVSDLDHIFFSCKIFGHQNPGSGLVLRLKCWIRIRTQWIRIQNTACAPVPLIVSIHKPIFILFILW